MTHQHDPEIVSAFFADGTFELTHGLVIWNELQTELAKYKELEMQARKAIFKKTWPAWKVGVNNHPLNNGYILKGTGKINYTVDKTMFPQVAQELARMDLSLDPFLRVQYSLAEGPYNEVMKDPQQKDTVGPILRLMVTSSEGAPTLEIVKSKSK